MDLVVMRLRVPGAVIRVGLVCGCAPGTFLGFAAFLPFVHFAIMRESTRKRMKRHGEQCRRNRRRSCLGDHDRAMEAVASHVAQLPRELLSKFAEGNPFI